MKIKKTFMFDLDVDLDYFNVLNDTNWTKEELEEQLNDLDIYDISRMYSDWTDITEWVELE